MRTESNRKAMAKRRKAFGFCLSRVGSEAERRLNEERARQLREQFKTDGCR